MLAAFDFDQRSSPATRPALLVLIAASLLTILFTGACGRAPKKEAKDPPIGWRPAASWSGHGDQQTDSFDIDNELWRLKWETRNETLPGKGTFKVTVHSAISGRPMRELVDHRGTGHDIAYVVEDPHLYFLVIESANLDWTVTVEESVTGEAQTGATGGARGFGSGLARKGAAAPSVQAK